MYFTKIVLMLCAGALGLLGQAALAGPVSPLDVKIAPRLVEINTLAGLKGVKAAILTAGLDTAMVTKYGIANQTLVLSPGITCAKEHRCMVGVTTVPEVEIGVNMSAIEEAHIRFADGFELMVKEY